MNRSLALFGIAALALGAYFFTGGSDDEDQSVSDHHITWNNRLWIDKLPSTQKEKIDLIVSVDDPRIGFFQHTSAFEGDFAMFGWSAKDNKITIEMLQTGKKHKLRMKVTDKDCGRFDYCLEVKGAPRGAKRYYSMEEWVIDGSSISDSKTLPLWARQQLASALANK